MKNAEIDVKLGIIYFGFFITVFWFYFEKLFHFVSLIKKISSQEAYMKSVRFKVKGKSFPKNLFLNPKVHRPYCHGQLKKMAKFCIKIFKDEFRGKMKTKISFFLLILGINILKLTIQTEKRKKTVFKYPKIADKTAATLIFSATLIITLTEDIPHTLIRGP
jgi:hypothetical protein